MDTDTPEINTDDMIIISKSIFQRYQVRFKIESGPAIPDKYSRSGAVMRLREVSAEWTLSGSGTWRLSSVTASGPRIKKDGSDSKIYGSNAYYGRDPHPFVALLDAHGPDAR